MDILDSFNLHEQVSFVIYPSAIVTTEFTNCRVVSSLDSDTMLAMGVDIQAKHANVSGTLPDSVGDYDSYQWLRIVLSNGDIEYIGEPWINADTVEVLTMRTLNFSIRDVTPAMENEIIRVLQAKGVRPENIHVS